MAERPENNDLRSRFSTAFGQTVPKTPAVDAYLDALDGRFYQQGRRLLFVLSQALRQIPDNTAQTVPQTRWNDMRLKDAFLLPKETMRLQRHIAQAKRKIRDLNPTAAEAAIESVRSAVTAQTENIKKTTAKKITRRS